MLSNASMQVILRATFQFRKYHEGRTDKNVPLLSFHYALHKDLGIICEEAPVNDVSLRDLVGCSVNLESDVPRLRLVTYPKEVASSGLCCGAPKEKRAKVVQFLEPTNLDETKARIVAELWCSLLLDVLVSHPSFQFPEFMNDLITSYNSGTINESFGIDIPKPPKRNLLVFVNPYSGNKKAVSVYNKVCKPIFLEAHVNCEVVHTERQNHCREFIQGTESLHLKYQGIVIVSGDGLLNEALQGVMDRPDWAQCIRNVAFGIIPAGTGNGIANSEAKMFGSEFSILRSAFVVAKGHSHSFDVIACDLKHSKADRVQVERRYSFLSLEWALAADLDIGSDYLRWMGHSRYTVEALKRMLIGRSYKGKLSYMPPETVPGYQGPVPTLCDNDNLVPPPDYWDRHQGDEAQPVTHMPPIDEPVPDSWIQVEDKFKILWSSNVEWIDASSRLSPGVTMHDGLMQLLYLRKNGPRGAGRVPTTKVLLGLETGEHVEYEAMECVPTRMFRLEPLSHFEEGLMAIDGEEVNYGPIQLEVLRGLGRFMVEGVIGHTDE